jgi:hypothetical protein
MDCQISVPQSAFRNPHFLFTSIPRSAFRNPHFLRSAIRISSSPRRLLAPGCDDHSNDD